MAATINNFISALHNPENSFSELSDLVVESSEKQGVNLYRVTHFAQAFIEWGEGRFLLSMPLDSEGLAMAQRASVRLRQLRSPLLLEYRVLPSEMRYIDSVGALRSADMVLSALPEGGRLLSEAIDSLEPHVLFPAVDSLERELRALEIAHCNLKMENLMIDGSNTLYPINMHNAEFGHFSPEEFEALRESIAQRLDVELPGPVSPLAPCDKPRSEIYGYSNVGNPFEGMCVAESSVGYGYIDPAGTEIIAPQFIWAGDMCEGRAEVETADGMGLIDAQGNFIIEPRYQIVEFNPETGLSQVKLNEQWMIFDYEGRFVEYVKEEECTLV